MTLTPEQLAALERNTKCPDCDSEFSYQAGHMSVSHDGTCPTLAQLEATNRHEGAKTTIDTAGNITHFTFGTFPETGTRAIFMTETPYS